MMLFKLGRSILPILTLALTLSCGKEVVEGEQSDVTRTIQNIPPSDLSLELNSSVSFSSTYLLPRDGVFILPPYLQVLDGNSSGKRVKISYNVLEDGNYEFHCIYESAGINGRLPLKYCGVGDELFSINAQNTTYYKFPMDQGKSIKMSLLNSSTSELLLRAYYDVDWK